MSEQDRYIPGVPCWVDTQQPDPAAALSFYGGLFGWDFVNAMPEGAGGEYHMAQIRGRDVAAVGGIPDGAPRTATWNTYIAVADADEAAAKARAAGGTVYMEPFDVMDAGRMAVIADPDAAVFCVWQAKENFGAKVVNEHGAVNFNRLATHDVEQAERFYGAVFGWRILPLDSGSMWVLPGYGDHLESKSPGLREQMGQMGAPDGFIDVVASVTPIAADDAGTPAHWSVVFGVDDADATAAKAAELGGKIVEAPHDAPWTRVTVIDDPQGATFVANQFVAENRDLKA